MAYRRTSRGMGEVLQSQIDPQYVIGADCAGGQIVTYPQGYSCCSTPADLAVLVGQKGYFTPGNPYVPSCAGSAVQTVAAASGGSAVTGAAAGSSTSGSSTTSGSSILDWVSSNPLIAAGIVGAVIFVAVKL